MSNEATTQIDRTGWPAGPWDTEPDRLDFTHAGLPCLVLRVDEFGHLCGYVAVPPGHPLHGVDYAEETHVLAERLESRMGEPVPEQPGLMLMLAAMAGSVAPRPDMALSVHGGLTYSSKCAGRICHVPAPGEPDDVWWFGFDCAHSGDLQPGMAKYLSEVGVRSRVAPLGKYRTVDYVRAECMRLAAQLSALTYAASDADIGGQA